MREVIAVGRQDGGFAWLIGDKTIHDKMPGSAAAIQNFDALPPATVERKRRTE
jgi:hypothetical protein